MLVGDILLSAREAVPDLPGTLPAPASANEIHLAPVTVAGGALGLGGFTSFWVVCTYSTPWGETGPGPEIQITLAGGNNAISANPAPSPYQQGLATGFNVYIGTASGAEIQRYSFTMAEMENPCAYIPGTFSFATPPQGSSAYLLDSGGPVASAQQLFRWLSDAMHALAGANGGVPDACGFPTIIGRQNYTLPGEWKSLNGAWYDGYPVNLGSSKSVFRHNTLNGLSGMLSYTQVADTLVCELYPQPQRTAGLTSLSAAIAAADVTAPTNGSGGFVLPFGLAMFGVPPNYEVVSYSGMGTGLAQLTRGLGGTSGQAWPTNTPVYELNCMFTGFRAPQLYTVGQSANTIRIPADWTPYIHMYLLARYRRIEQNEQECTTLMKDFDAYLAKCSKRKPVVGERQIQPDDWSGIDVRAGLSSTFGGIVIP
jgi:hypothetical protein